MGLSDLGSEETVKWFRACELKHGRIAMMATLGWVHQSFGAARRRPVLSDGGRVRETKRERKSAARAKRERGAQRKKAGARATRARRAASRANARGTRGRRPRARIPPLIPAPRTRSRARAPSTFSLKQLSVKPLEANVQLWQMGLLPWLQIFLTIGALELLTEATVKPHYFSKVCRRRRRAPRRAPRSLARPPTTRPAPPPPHSLPPCTNTTDPLPFCSLLPLPPTTSSSSYYDLLLLLPPQEGTGYINFFGVEETSANSAELNRLKMQELKHGRLAMIGIASFFCSAVIPGSVPAPATSAACEPRARAVARARARSTPPASAGRANGPGHRGSPHRAGGGGGETSGDGRARARAPILRARARAAGRRARVCAASRLAGGAARIYAHALAPGPRRGAR